MTTLHERRLERLEVDRTPPPEPPSAADVAATALWLWEQTGLKSPHTGVLSEQAAKGGQVMMSACRAAMGYLSDEALNVLAETVMENVNARA